MRTRKCVAIVLIVCFLMTTAVSAFAAVDQGRSAKEILDNILIELQLHLSVSGQSWKFVSINEAGVFELYAGNSPTDITVQFSKATASGAETFAAGNNNRVTITVPCQKKDEGNAGTVWMHLSGITLEKLVSGATYVAMQEKIVNAVLDAMLSPVGETTISVSKYSVTVRYSSTGSKTQYTTVITEQ